MIILRRPRRQRLLLFLTLAFTLVSLIIIYPEICKNVGGAAYNFENFPNSTYLLTINHDHGRMGNKMFKYASLLGIAKREGRTPFVLPYIEHLDMENIFKMTHVLHDSNYWTNWWSTIKETDYAYDDPVFENLPRKNLKLLGYVQSWKYFQNVEDYVRQEFRLTDKLKFEADGILNSIRQNSTGNGNVVFIGVHVRRLDKYSMEKTTISPKSFFLKSFEKMKSLFPGQQLIFVVAGNDLDWCKENLAGENVTILEPASPSVHFAVLSSCQHFIVSVGSFGWWAGWLTGGHVIFYKDFPLPESHEAKGFHFQDYYPPSWIPVGD